MRPAPRTAARLAGVCAGRAQLADRVRRAVCSRASGRPSARRRSAAGSPGARAGGAAPAHGQVACEMPLGDVGVSDFAGAVGPVLGATFGHRRRGARRVLVRGEWAPPACDVVVPGGRYLGTLERQQYDQQRGQQAMGHTNHRGAIMGGTGGREAREQSRWVARTDGRARRSRLRFARAMGTIPEHLLRRSGT